jgi:hypothetical protein
VKGNPSAFEAGSIGENEMTTSYRLLHSFLVVIHLIKWNDQHQGIDVTVVEFIMGNDNKFLPLKVMPIGYTQHFAARLRPPSRVFENPKRIVFLPMTMFA